MSTSFAEVRGLIAREVEPTGVFRGVTTSAGPAGVVTCSSFAMRGGDARALDGAWLYFCDGTLAGQERAIAEAGLSVAGGDISVGNNFSAVTPLGATFEVHQRMPVTETPGGTPWVTGYRPMVNDALTKLWYADELAISAVSGQVRYLLDSSTYPWLADRATERVMAVLGPADTSSGIRPEVFGRNWYVEVGQSETPELVLRGSPYTTGQTFYVRVARPCSSRIQIGGVWTDVSTTSPNPGNVSLGIVGVYADTDRTHANPLHVKAMVLADAMNQLAMRAPALETDRWEARRRYWTSVASGITQRRLPRPSHQDFRPTVVGRGRRR